MPEINWLPQDAVASREYFNSTAGQKLLSILQAHVKLADGESYEEEALNYRFVKGSLAILNKLISMLDDPAPPQANEMEFVNTSEDSTSRN